MTTINRVTAEMKVISAAVEYSRWRYQVDHVNARADRRCTMDAVRLFDALELAELHLLTAVKRLPAQCLDDDDWQMVGG
jgi:hypothetical protein